MVQSLNGLPAFLIYFVCASVLVAAYLFFYTRITPHDEFALIRKNVPGAAISLGFSIVGFALPLTSSIAHSDSVVDMTMWGIVALVVQIGAYYVARIPVRDLSDRIAAGELGPAIWLGGVSITAGLLNAASMAT